MSDEGEMTVREAGRIGGRKRAETADYEAMGRKGGAETAKRGRAYYEAIGKLGGTKRREKGCDFVALGKKGGARVKELIARGKAVAADGPEIDGAR